LGLAKFTCPANLARRAQRRNEHIMQAEGSQKISNAFERRLIDKSARRRQEHAPSLRFLRPLRRRSRGQAHASPNRPDGAHCRDQKEVGHDDDTLNRSKDIDVSDRVTGSQTHDTLHAPMTTLTLSSSKSRVLEPSILVRESNQQMSATISKFTIRQCSFGDKSCCFLRGFIDDGRPPLAYMYGFQT